MNSRNYRKFWKFCLGRIFTSWGIFGLFCKISIPALPMKIYTKTVQICNYRPVAISMMMEYVNKNVPQCKDTILLNTNGRKTQMENTLMAPPVLGIVQNISWRIMGPVLGFVPRTKRLLKGNVSHVMGHVLKLAIFLKSYMLETSKNWKTAQSLKVSSIFSKFFIPI